MLLASSVWRPGMLLNILQCTGQNSPHPQSFGPTTPAPLPPPPKSYPAPNVNSADVEKPCCVAKLIDRNRDEQKRGNLSKCREIGECTARLKA